MDITEIQGADELYHARGIIRRSEENAAFLFGAKRTLYSTEGSSLCIRAMVYLALLHGKETGKKPLILAGRNAHKAFLSACALLDAEVNWLYPEGDGVLIACRITPEGLEKALRDAAEPPAAVYVTSPDYLGNMLDIHGLARVCRERGVLLLVDNAHGAYLKFLPEDSHPISLGADLCCDSAHKTLPCLTGGAYLHIGNGAPDTLFKNAERALSLFASSSPSYLILQSLDQCCAYLSGSYPLRLKKLTERIASLKEKLTSHGWAPVGGEPAKITVKPKAFGYTGDDLHGLLRRQNMECEFSDPDCLTMMFTPENSDEEINRLETVLLSVPGRNPIFQLPPPLPRPERVLSIRKALLSPSVETPIGEALGRVFADAQVSCPPCIPIIMSGERIDENAVRCFRYYGVSACRTAKEDQ